MFRILIRFIRRSVLVLLVLLATFAIYFVIAVQIKEPVIADRSPLQWKREEITPYFFKVKNNWLKKSESGIWELYVEGDGFERGAANGILTKELHAFQEDAFVNQIKILVPDLNYLKFLKYFVGYFNRHLPDNIIEEYQQEIYGISQFASDKYDFIASKYHRILNYHGAHDIGHALADKNMTVGCTSFSVWNKKSADGKLLVGRNFDFYSGDDFAKNKIVQFTNPKTGYKFATVTWAGFIGAASGMNEKGITVTINAAKSEIPTDVATPIALLAREILQYAKNINEAIEIVKKRKVFVSESILVGSSSDNKTVSIEKTPSQMDVYEVENTDQIICPNHYQGSLFQHDLTNLNNRIESSSLFRQVRLKELLGKNDTINYTIAAQILRNQKGINNKNIGLGNEKALNQLIAHHSVIFKPKDRLMWVSANPYQCGKFVCYDLNKVFSNAKELNEQKEIYETQLTIPADEFLKTEGYKNFVLFKELKHYIHFITKAPGDLQLPKKLEDAFIACNTQSYFMWQILGDYHRSKKNYDLAIKYYQTALQKEIATLKEKKQIEESLSDCKNSHEAE